MAVTGGVGLSSSRGPGGAPTARVPSVLKIASQPMSSRGGPVRIPSVLHGLGGAMAQSQGHGLPHVPAGAMPFRGTGVEHAVSPGAYTHPLGAPPAAPTSPGASSTGGAGEAPPVSPLDSTALMNIAQSQFKTSQRINGLAEKQGYDNADLQRVLSQLQQGKNIQERTAMEQANSRGLLSSTTLGNNLGAIGQSAADRATVLNSNNVRANAQIDSEIAGLRTGEGLYEDAQRLGAVQRAAAADAANKALGEPANVAPAASAALSPAAPAAPIAPAHVPAITPAQAQQIAVQSRGMGILPNAPIPSGLGAARALENARAPVINSKVRVPNAPRGVIPVRGGYGRRR